MKENKLIIDIKNNDSHLVALEKCKKVIERGSLTELKNDYQYCGVTTFYDNTIVQVIKNRKSQRNVE